MRRTVLVALVVALAASGCGKASPSAAPSTSPSPAAAVLTKAELARVLITPKDVGDRFKVGKDDTDDDSDLGCLDKFGDVEELHQDVRHAEIEIDAAGDFGLPVLYDAVGTFATVDRATAAMTALRKKLATCTHTTGTDPHDHSRYDLTVTHDDEAADGADDQVNVTAGGTIRVSGATIKVAFEIAEVRVGNNVLLAGFGTAGKTSATDDLAQVVALVLPRLTAVVAGRPVPPADPLGLTPLTIREALTGTAEATA